MSHILSLFYFPCEDHTHTHTHTQHQEVTLPNSIKTMGSGLSRGITTVPDSIFGCVATGRKKETVGSPFPHNLLSPNTRTPSLP